MCPNLQGALRLQLAPLVHLCSTSCMCPAPHTLQASGACEAKLRGAYMCLHAYIVWTLSLIVYHVYYHLHCHL